MEPQHEERPHLPAPSLYPVGFAAGVACVLVGLIVSPTFVAPIGGAIAIVFGFLWAREATMEYRGVPEHVEPERRPAPALGRAPAVPATAGEAAMPAPLPGERFPRSRFLEGATLGLGGLIGAIVSLPAAGFALLPGFKGQKAHEVDVGPLSDFAENKWNVVTFLRNPSAGGVSRGTAFVRNNGLLNG